MGVISSPKPKQFECLLRVDDRVVEIVAEIISRNTPPTKAEKDELRRLLRKRRKTR